MNTWIKQRSTEEKTLFLVCAVLSIALIWWLSVDQTPPHWDMSNHLMNALTYHDRWIENLHHGHLGLLRAIKHWWSDYLYYPPGLYWLTLPIAFFARTPDALTLINIPLLFVFAFSVYFLATKVFTRQWALWAAIIAATSPILLSQTHQYQLDFPLTTTITAALALLAFTECFTKRTYSILFGLVAGYAMLTKWPAMAFIVVPALYSIIIGLLRENRKKVLINLGLAIVGFVIVALPWYLYNLSLIRKDLQVNINTGIGEGDPAVLSRASFRWYTKVFLLEYLRGLYLPFFLGGIGVAIADRAHRRYWWFFLLTVLGSYLIMTLYQNKDYRFIMPLTGVGAIFVVATFAYGKNWWQRIGHGYFLLVTLFIFVTITFGISGLPREWRVSLGQGWALPIYAQYGYFSAAPVGDAWPNEQILTDIQADAASQKIAHVRIAMDYPDEPYFNKENFKFFIQEHNLPMEVTFPFTDKFTCQDDNYLVVRQMAGFTEMVRPTQTACQFQLLETKTIPGGDAVKVYRVMKK